jgi:uncharacterized membrane protein required for colicin V production
MIDIAVAFWMLVFVFAIIGAMRGWAKEVLVTASVVLALFALDIARILPAIGNLLNQNDTTSFWIQSLVVAIFALFGYQTPKLIRGASGKFVSDKFADTLVGFFIGALNGFLIVGCIWYFMIQSQYPFQPEIIPPVPPPPAVINYLPPEWLDGLVLYFGLLVSFLFILIVFI